MAKKARVNFTLDEDLYKKMKLCTKKVGINWSQLVEQALRPTVVAIDDMIKQVEASGEKDVTKLRLMFQKILFDVTGSAFKAHEAIERDFDILERRIDRKKVVVRKKGLKTEK